MKSDTQLSEAQKGLIGGFKSRKGQHHYGGVDATIRITGNENVGMALSKLQKQ